MTAALAVSVVALPRPPRDTRPLVRFDLDLGGELADRTLGVLAFSPDGTRIAVPVRGPDGLPVLSARRVDQPDGTLLHGTEGADQPFFSTDGRWIAFVAGNKLRKVPVQGGTSVDIADVRNPRGGSWAEDGTIVAALANTSGLSQVPGDGGPPQPLTTLQDGELTHRWPQVLPGSGVVLFTAHSGTINSYENASIVVLSRADGARKTVWRGGYHGRFIPTDGRRGHLVFVHRGILHAVRFDVDRLEVEGTPVPLLQDLASDPESAAGEIGDLGANAISHDNRRLIYTRMDPVTAGDLWILPVDPGDPDRPQVGQPELFLRTPANESRPAFSPDGRWVAYSSNESGTIEVYVRASATSSGAGGTWQISSGGGGTPIWSRTAPELYFSRAGQIMVSEYIVRGSSFEAGKPRVWSKQRLHQTAFTNFDLAPDGKQFAIVPDASASPVRVRVTMLLNFFDELRRQLP